MDNLIVPTAKQAMATTAEDRRFARAAGVVIDSAEELALEVERLATELTAARLALAGQEEYIHHLRRAMARERRREDAIDTAWKIAAISLWTALIVLVFLWCVS